MWKISVSDILTAVSCATSACDWSRRHLHSGIVGLLLMLARASLMSWEVTSTWGVLAVRVGRVRGAREGEAKHESLASRMSACVGDVNEPRTACKSVAHRFSLVLAGSRQPSTSKLARRSW